MPSPLAMPKTETAKPVRVRRPKIEKADHHPEPKRLSWAMQTITITDGGWVDSQPLNVRPEIVKTVYSLATEFGWVVRVEGQHWDLGLAA